MLRQRLIERIAASGPLPFEAFMEACLYDPDDGFFGAGPLRSVKSGDFLTSPEVSPWFGRTIGRFAQDVLARIGSGETVVVDVGAGSGSLLGPLIGALGSTSAYHAIDASPAARAALGALIPPGHVHPRIEDVAGPFAGLVVANELLDNLPVALAVRHGGGWEERWVGFNGADLELIAAPVRSDVAAWCDRYGGTVPAGGLVEVQLAAAQWIETVMSRLDRGCLLVIDYGGTAEELEPRRTQGTLRTYRAHHLGPDPLLEPGATDVTVDVNFTALQAVAVAAGATVLVQRQDDFLAEHGLRDVISGLRLRESELAAGDDAMERLRVRAERVDAETLLHPRGLGDFRVLTATR